MNECDIFMAALEIESPPERDAYLDEACGKDTPLRQRVEALLESHAKSGSLLEHPAAEGATAQLFEGVDKLAHATSDAGCAPLPLDEISLDFLEASDSPDSLGRLGQYEITEVVGRGGMGIVLKGHDPKLSRVVAVKVLAPELASNASARKRFLREGRAAAAVSHDHVVTIYGIDDAGSLPFIAMEYISGQSLEDRIMAEGSLELTEILRIGMQIASGLAAAHEQGLAHRDIKPANILLENGVEKVKITDFGLARAVDDVRMTKPGVVTGTPEYMSPEQARGESVDHRTDLFSLGCVIYAMCAGRSPFRAENTPAMIRRVCEDTPRPIQDVNSDVPGWLVHIIEELLEKSVDERFQSASELADLLGQCLAHLQQPSVNPLPERLDKARVTRRRTGTRRRGWLAAAAALLIALGGLSLTEATGVTEVTGTVIRLVRGDGTLVIEVDDPEVSVSVDGEELVITGAGAKEIRLGVGQHELKALKNGEPVHTELVTITRNGKQVVKVEVEPMTPVATEVAEAPETEREAVIALQDTWPYEGLGDLDVLSISRDGRYSAFVDHDTGGLAVRALSTGKEQLLSNRMPQGYEVRISSDGQWVAYVGGDPEKGDDLRIVGVDGSGERVLYPNEEKNGIRLAGWSPDGQCVLAALFEPVEENRGPTSVPVRIATFAVADGSIRVLKSLTAEETDVPRPLFSPDGRYVVYGRVTDTTSKQQDIFLIPLDGSPEVPLVESGADDLVFHWLADGKILLFRSDRRGEGHDLWMIHIMDGKPRSAPRLVQKGLPAPESKYCLGPVQTPTGGWAFYYRTMGESTLAGSVHLGALDPDNEKPLQAPEQITRPTTGRERALCPDFSRDGEFLAYYVAPAYERTPEGPRCAPGNIVIRTLETGDEREITLSPRLSVRGTGQLRWAPDGRSILTQGRIETGYQGIFQIDVETGKLAPVVTRPTQTWQHAGEAEYEFAARGEWSPDGKTIFYVRGRKDPAKGLVVEALVAHDLETGREREVYRDPDGDFKVVGGVHAVSPDGKHVVIEDSESLKILPTTGGEARELVRLEGARSHQGSSVVWMPDSRFLLYKRMGQATWEIWRIAAQGGDPERVGEVPRFLRTVLALRVHPDGRRLVFCSGYSIQQRRIRMLQIAGLDELDKEMCATNMRSIAAAIEEYKNDHGDVPDGFADLYPDYLEDPNLLICPADEGGGKPREGAEDPEMRRSYGYQFDSGTDGVWAVNVPLPARFPAREGMTWKDAKKLQVEYYGGIVPIVTCGHHDALLYLGYDGKIYETKGSWRRSPQAMAGLLNQLKATTESEPAAWAQRYEMQRFACYLNDDAALTKFLETCVKEHPEDQAAGEFLAELPRLRFICDRNDDAEEDVDDGTVANKFPRSWLLELIHDADPDVDEDQVVGIRFQDIPVPQGARIKRAYLQFTAWYENAGTEKTDLVLHAELAANAEPFTRDRHNITSRRKTAASVKWSPEPWTVGSERSEKQRTPDLSSLIQEVVNQPDWKQGASLALVISGSGRRSAVALEGSWSGAPMLYVEH